MGLLEYSTNNSGGSWWLQDDDWRALEEAGWTVEWKTERWLDALATDASIETDDPTSAVHQFEEITGQNADDGGCSCCGPPHSFTYSDDTGTHYFDSYPTGYERSWS